MKKLFALVLCLALMITCFAGCHEKGEIAVKVGEIEFTSGYYACALVFADTEARATVEENLTEDGETPDDINYWKQKIDKTDYVKWVENKALDTLKELAAIKDLCAKADVKLDDETIESAESNAEYLWDSYGYSALMESNGVSEATFKAYMQDTYLADEYFKHLYGEGGDKAIATDQVSKQLTDNYVLANVLSVSFSGLTDTQKKEKNEQLTGFETALKNGTKTFEQVYLEYYNQSAEDHKHETAEGESAPKDPHASVLGAKDTQYESDQFDTAKKMAAGEVKLVTLEKDEGLVLIVKQDINADPYYIKEFDTMLRQDIVGDDFDKDIETHSKTFDINVKKSAIGQFDVKKIKYPEQ